MDLDQDIQVIHPKRQECQPRGQAPMEDARNSISSQRLASTFETLLNIPEADITAIPVVRYEQFPTVRSGNIPVSVQELVYDRKTARMRAPAKLPDRENELLYSSEEVLGPRKYKRTYEGLYSNVLQRESPIHKRLIENPKHVVRGPEEAVGPKEGQYTCVSSSSLHKKNQPQQVPIMANAPYHYFMANWPLLVFNGLWAISTSSGHILQPLASLANSPPHQPSGQYPAFLPG
ncbi:hypothetical protein O181_098250 [Austropuccinia psidii MF-1]|uniref:Uncharacterized protein n=1 Tax=Austropuccinia psidii MF-1 TaxID=1389203 RepID=A0A9Q3JB78_9BASI|nr:hypothetical protein [Austropuccinia psidii MF-1]